MQKIQKLPAEATKTLKQWRKCFEKITQNKKLTKAEKELICTYTAGGVQAMLTKRHSDLGKFNVMCDLTDEGNFDIRTNFKAKGAKK